MTKKRVLIFPAGSEIGLEIFESLRFSRHFEVLGATSVKDHSQFVFKNLFQVPYFQEENFKAALIELIEKEQVDYLFPAMDSVLLYLKEIEESLDAKVVASPLESLKIANDKKCTYKHFLGKIPIPKTFTTQSTLEFPLFLKPKVGYGSRNSAKINNQTELSYWTSIVPDYILSEYLPGEEFTVDCFTSSQRVLQYSHARSRFRIRMGISVGSSSATSHVQEETKQLASIINEKLSIRGGWFFQVKRSKAGQLTLLEIGLRMAGSSGLNRIRGVNLPLLTLFDLEGLAVELIPVQEVVTIDRAFSIKTNLDFQFDQLYIDLDDCLILEGELNPEAIQLIVHCLNKQKKVILLTKHRGDLTNILERFRIRNIFDRIIHLEADEIKADFIESRSLFVDDSYAERKLLQVRNDVLAFGVESIPLINSSFK